MIEPKNVKWYLQGKLCNSCCGGFCKKPASNIDKKVCNPNDKVYLYTCKDCPFFMCYKCLMDIKNAMEVEMGEASGGRRVSGRKTRK